MSTAQNTVRRALRLMGVLFRGREPSGADAADGLERLQTLILALPGLQLNGVWREVAVTAAYTAREGDRCTVTAPGAVTLPLTVTPCDGELGGCTRPPLDLAKVQIIGAVPNAGVWLYSATKGAWGQADALTLKSELPFGGEDDDGVAALLAVNMQDEYSETPLGDRSVALAQQFARSARARLKKAEPPDHRRPGYHHHVSDYC